MAELEYYNVPFVVEMDYDNGLNIDITSYTGAARLQLTVVYRNNGNVAAIDVSHIKVDKFGSRSFGKQLDTKYECADVYVTYGTDIVASGYVYLRSLN